MKRIVPVLFCVALAGASCAHTPYKRLATGYNMVRFTKKFAELFDASVKKAVADIHAACKGRHQIKTVEFDKCVLPVMRVSWAWTGEKAGKKTGKGALSLLQAGQKATKFALDGAYDYVKSNEKACSGDNPPKDCHGDYKVLMKPGLCALWTVADAGVKAGAYKATKDPTYLLVKGAAEVFLCKGARIN